MLSSLNVSHDPGTLSRGLRGAEVGTTMVCSQGLGGGECGCSERHQRLLVLLVGWGFLSCQPPGKLQPLHGKPG